MADVEIVADPSSLTRAVYDDFRRVIVFPPGLPEVEQAAQVQELFAERRAGPDAVGEGT